MILYNKNCIFESKSGIGGPSVLSEYFILPQSKYFKGTLYNTYIDFL